MLEIETLVNKITENNEAYRTGNVKVSDEVYDAWVDRLEELDPSNPLLLKVGFITDGDNRKQKLPILMASMNKVKTISDLLKWFTSKNIPKDTELVLTPKYDGCSFCSNEVTKKGYTRGDGEYGQRSDEHLEFITKNEQRMRALDSLLDSTESTFTNPNMHIFGEIIMPRQTFLDTYSSDFKNPRNFVGGLLNSDEAREPLNDCKYVRYGLICDDMVSQFGKKSVILDYLNTRQTTKVPYKIVTIDDLTEENLKELFFEWSKDFEIDGIVIEINDLAYVESLGREKGGNPCYNRAYKGSFEEQKTSIVQEIEWNISKKGYIIPRIRITPVALDGVTVSYITGNNANYISEMGIGIGAELLIKRSGMVIPFVIGVTKKVEFEIPDIGYELKWDENHVHLITTEETDEQRLQQIISFFKILGVENVSEGVCSQLFESGFNTVKSILSMNREDMLKLDRFGDKKVEIVYNAIHSKMKDVTLSTLQHSSGFFDMLGSKRLLLLEHLENPTMEDICKIEGFSNKSAMAYLDGVSKFNEFIGDLNGLITVKKTEIDEIKFGILTGKSFVFSGYRDKETEDKIKELGGEIKSGISKNVTHLVVKDKQSGSSKIVKAEKLDINIMTVDELEEMLEI